MKDSEAPTADNAVAFEPEPEHPIRKVFPGYFKRLAAWVAAIQEARLQADEVLRSQSPSPDRQLSSRKRRKLLAIRMTARWCEELLSDFDSYRAQCEAQQSAAEPALTRCPSCTHAMYEHFTHEKGYTCDECLVEWPTGTRLAGCRDCNLDICQRCARGETLRRRTISKKFRSTSSGQQKMWHEVRAPDQVLWRGQHDLTSKEAHFQSPLEVIEDQGSNLGAYVRLSYIGSEAAQVDDYRLGGGTGR